jgi:putative membrane protein
MNNFESPFARFVTRWLVCSLGLWIAAGFLSSSITFGNSFMALLVAGLLLAIINIVIKPILIIFSLPFIVFTLGFFMIVINGLTVYLASKLYGPLHITDFWAAMFAGVVIGLVNFLVSIILKEL